MHGAVLGLLAETSVHPGAGQADSAIDLPVARERVTGYPYVPGSGVKGALRQKITEEAGAALADTLCGQPDQAGALLIGDARLVLLPVRSLTGSYKWLTCPHLLERLHRDRARLGLAAPGAWPGCALPVDAGETPVLTRPAPGETRLFLEERNFAILPGRDAELDTIAGAVGGLIADAAVRARLAGQLAVVDDDAFAWFAANALPVEAHNLLEPSSKRSMNLWYEETLPPDTVLHVVLERRSGLAAEAPDPMAALGERFAAAPYLRLGGNETVGQGWFHCRLGEEA